MTVADREALLKEAMQYVTQDRTVNYGTPESNFKLIAALWDIYLSVKADSAIEGHDVAIMMILMKVARLANSPAHHDSWVDIAGYAACGNEVAQIMRDKGIVERIVEEANEIEPDLVHRTYREYETTLPPELRHAAKSNPDVETIMRVAAKQKEREAPIE